MSRQCWRCNTVLGTGDSGGLCRTCDELIHTPRVTILESEYKRLKSAKETLQILTLTSSICWRTDAPPEDGRYFLAAIEGWGSAEDGILYRLMRRCTDGISKQFNDDCMHFSCKKEEISAWMDIPKWRGKNNG